MGKSALQKSADKPRYYWDNILCQYWGRLHCSITIHCLSMQSQNEIHCFKDVLSKGFDKQVSNHIVNADKGDVYFAMMKMFTKMIIAYIDMLCAQ